MHLLYRYAQTEREFGFCFQCKELLCSYLHICILHLYAFEVPVYPVLPAIDTAILILAKNFNETSIYLPVTARQRARATHMQAHTHAPLDSKGY